MEALDILDHINAEIAISRLLEALATKDAEAFRRLASELSMPTACGFLRAYYKAQSRDFDWMMNALCMVEGYEEIVCRFWMAHWQLSAVDNLDS